MTKRRPAIEVEPLSAKRWAQIERNVLERAAIEPPSPAPAIDRRRWIAAGVVIAAAAAIVVAWILRPPAPAREALAASSHIVTEGAPTHTTAGDVAIDLDPRSSLMLIERERDAWLVSIEHGGARFRVPPRSGRPTFVVQAGLVRVEVVGTRFHVQREPGSTAVQVDVEQGTVRVIAGGQVVLVNGGERWPAEEPAPAQAAEARAGRDLSAESASDPLEAPPAERRIARSSERDRGEDRQPEAPADPPEGRVQARPHDGPQYARRADGDPGEGPPAIDSPAADPPAVDPPRPEETEAIPAPVANLTAQRFARAQALEPTDPATALRDYEALAREGGAWGALALYAQARLELELGHRVRARALLERYLAQHPRGYNAEDARGLLAQMR